MNVLVLIGGPLFVLGLVHIAFGLLCLKKARGPNLVRIYAAATAFVSSLYCLTISTAYLRAAAGLDSAFFYRFTWVGWFLAPTTLQLTYALGSKAGRFEKFIAWALYPIWILMTYLIVTTDLFDMEPQQFFPYIDRGGPWELPLRLVANLQTAWFLYSLFRLYRASIGFKRQQIGYLIFGLTLFALGAGFLQFPFLGRYILDPGLGAYFSLPFIGATLYAVMKHRLFDLRLVVSKIISSVILITLFVTLHISAVHVLEGGLGAKIGLLVASLITAIVAFGSPVVDTIRKLFDQIILKKTFDHKIALKKSSEALISIFNIDDLLRKFIEIGRKSLGIRDAGFYLFRNGSFQRQCRSEGEDQVDSDSSMAPDSAIVTWLTKNRKILVREEQINTLSDEEMEKLNQEFKIAKAEAAVPVFYKGVLNGFLTLGYKSNKDAFLDEDLTFLETLASQAAIAVENAKLFQESTTDGLTGLYHQKYFKTRLRSEYERAVRHGHPLILALLDIDHFKTVNDTYGHIRGDLVLKGVAKILQGSFRIEDLVARYGGEEFAVLLSEPDPKAAAQVSERIRKRIESADLEGIHVTVSVGIYVFDKSTDCHSELDVIERADKALYKAKNTGRNRVIFYEEVSKLRIVK